MVESFIWVLPLPTIESSRSTSSPAMIPVLTPVLKAESSTSPLTATPPAEAITVSVSMSWSKSTSPVLFSSVIVTFFISGLLRSSGSATPLVPAARYGTTIRPGGRRRIGNNPHPRRPPSGAGWAQPAAQAQVGRGALRSPTMRSTCTRSAA